jgi:hypothetical protein
MGCKVGSFAIPSSSTFNITGLGFQPRWVLFLTCNTTPGEADTWTGRPSAGIGMAAMQNTTIDDSGATVRNAQISEVWYNSNVGGSFLGDLISWIRDNGLTGENFAMYVPSLNPDGFTVAFAGGGYNVNAVGKVVYYLAGDGSYEEVASSLAFVPGTPSYELGFEPFAMFGIGAGGDVAPFGNTQSMSFLDISIPSVCGGYFDDGDFPVFASQWRGIIDPNIDVQEWWGSDEGGDVTILEETQGGGVQFSTMFSASKTDTAIVPSFNSAGFSLGHVRMAPIMFGKVACVTGSFVPSTTTGVWTEVALPFEPEAVVFFSVQDDKSGVGNTSVYGATVWGFCTDEDQAVLGYGGFWNPPIAQTSAQFHSPDLAWIGNCIETGAIGSVVSAGEARCTPNGFEHKTNYHNASVMYPVLYWAIAPVVEVPGFFRRYGG